MDEGKVEISNDNYSKNIKVYYYNYPNLGDILNPLLIEKLFSVKVIFEQYTKADLIAIGSVLDRLLENGRDNERFSKINKEMDKNNKIHVWGTGLMYQYEISENQNFARPVEIHALRGKLTEKIVLQALNGPGGQKVTIKSY